MFLVKVLVEYQNILLDRYFDYYSCTDLKPYTRVSINFNNKKIVGFVIESSLAVKANNNYEIKVISEIIDEYPLINDELFEIVSFLSNKYLSSRISALQTILPPSLKPHKNKLYNPSQNIYIEYVDSSAKLTQKQASYLEIIKRYNDISLKNITKEVSREMIKTLESKGCIKRVKKNKLYTLVDEKQEQFNKLNLDQQNVYDTIINSDKDKFLLHGVTGSGKTEIFLHLTKYYLEQDANVLILVPEITLSLMMQKRFASRFKNNIAIIHSKLSNSEKYQEYNKIAEGKVNIVVGTRSSVFVPLKNIKLIIIDEEHDSSYKQNNGLMYNTHDVALFRAKYSIAKVVFASATPSFTSMTNAYVEKYEYLPINSRFAKQALPKISLVDLSNSDISNLVSEKVMNRINYFINCDKQVIILLNRRGYNHFFQCRECSSILMCPQCNVALTYHKDKNSLQCHHCFYETKEIYKCFYCKSKQIKRLGFGTQRIEEYLNKHFSKYGIIRIDQDSVSKKNQLDKCLNDFKKGNYKILLGTQMIAKGLDFEDVDLVVVLNIDNALTFNHYDANEKIFSLLLQVAGRSGRHSGNGEVMIETFQPNHFVLKHVLNGNYIDFYKEEIYYRKLNNYPPFYKIALITIGSYDESKLSIEVEMLVKYLNNTITNVIISDKKKYGIYKLANMYRYNIEIKYKRVDDIYLTLYNLKKQYSNKRNFTFTVDIDN